MASLDITHPQLARQWCSERNGDLIPADVTSRSKAVVWWICDGARPHVWQAAVSARATSDSGCPACANLGKKLLQDHHPELAREFHPTKNRPLVVDGIGIGFEKRVWWRCAKNASHEWQAPVPMRIQRPSCPLCDGRIVTPETSLAGRFPEIAKEWHPARNGALRPEEVRPCSTRKAWWQCSRNPAHEWQTTPGIRTQKNSGCPVCFGSALSPEVTFAATHPEVAAEWHPTKNGRLKPDQMRAGSDRKVWWRCARDPSHEWRTFISNRARGTTCPMCSGRVATPTTSLRALYPEVAARWHPTKNGKLTPDNIKLNAKRKVWWLCPKDSRHEWQAPPKAMGKCPICVGKKVILSSSLAGHRSGVVAQWHPTKNGDLNPAELYRYSLVRVWWQCPKDPLHEWEATIASRTKSGAGCPYCDNRLAGPNTSLAALRPEVAAEWHPEKNGDLTPDQVVPGAGVRVWWRCKLGHETQARVYERGVAGAGCKGCFMIKHRAWLAENNRARARQRRGESG